MNSAKIVSRNVPEAGQDFYVRMVHVKTQIKNKSYFSVIAMNKFLGYIVRNPQVISNWNLCNELKTLLDNPNIDVYKCAGFKVDFEREVIKGAIKVSQQKVAA